MQITEQHVFTRIPNSHARLIRTRVVQRTTLCNANVNRKVYSRDVRLREKKKKTVGIRFRAVFFYFYFYVVDQLDGTLENGSFDGNT